MDWKEKLSKEWNKTKDIKPDFTSNKKNVDIRSLVALYAIKKSNEFYEAQVSAVNDYSKNIGKPIVGEYIWADNCEMELSNVLEHCEMARAHLAVAKLEEFPVEIIAQLNESGVSFVEVGMPDVKFPEGWMFPAHLYMLKKYMRENKHCIDIPEMKFDFGIVKKYFVDRGFGFVGHTFQSSNSNGLFFHINKVKKSNPDLVRKLENFDSTDSVFFWYEFEESNKGKQVSAVLKLDQMFEKYKNELIILVEKIECIWSDIDSEIPDWLNQVSIDLIGSDHADDLISKRNNLELIKNKDEESKRIKNDALLKKDDSSLGGLINEERIKIEVEDKEFRLLIAEMASLGFTSSKQLSAYIIRNKLGYKYSNISGVVKMEKDGDTWDYKGGFPPTIYKRICEELGLASQGSSAKVVAFKSFNDLFDK